MMKIRRVDVEVACRRDRYKGAELEGQSLEETFFWNIVTENNLAK